MDELTMHNITVNRRPSRKKPLDVAFEFIFRNEDQPGFEAKKINSAIGPTKQRKQRKYTKPTPWTVEENQAIRRQMGEFLFDKKTPNQKACEAARAKEPALQRRHWRRIKDKVQGKERRTLN